MELTRRSFFKGLGAVSVSLLFHRQLDAVLDSLAADLVAEPPTPAALPCAAEIIVSPQLAFRPRRLIVPDEIGRQFLIEDISIGPTSQLLTRSISARFFSPNTLYNDLPFATAAGGTDIRFRVRYVGTEPRGARFIGSLIGDAPGGAEFPGRTRSAILPIDSFTNITA